MKIRKLILSLFVIMLILSSAGFYYTNKQKQIKNEKPYDYVISSDFGFVYEDVESLINVNGIKMAEGIYEISDDNYILQSYPGSFIKPSIVDGREALKRNEAVLDERLKDSAALGETYSFEINDKTYEVLVVGFAEPKYIETDKYFIYQKLSSFKKDYYNRIYLKLEKEADTEEMVDAISDICNDGNDRRYEILLAKEQSKIDTETELRDTVLDSYKGELDEAKKLLDETKDKLFDGSVQRELEEASDKLASAKKQLSDAAAEIENNRAILDNAKAELDSSKQQIDSKNAEYEATLSANGLTRGEIDSSIDNLNNQMNLLYPLAFLPNIAAQIDSLRQARDSLYALKDAGNQIDQAYAEYYNKYNEYENGRSRLNAAVNEYNSKKAEYENGLNEYNRKVSEYEKAKKEYNESLSKYNESESEYNRLKDEYDEKIDKYVDSMDDIKILDWTIRAFGRDGREKYVR